MKTTFNWGDDIIDSRDIISRHSELQDEYDSLVEAWGDATNDLDNYLSVADDELTEDDTHFEKLCTDFREVIGDAKIDLDLFDKEELDLLSEVISAGEQSPDWSYGEILILDSHFQDYTEELINDCWEMPKEFDSNSWPWRHMKIDFEEAADELKSDYISINVQNEEYWIRA